MSLGQSAMVLAAGFGTRMGELTKTCPKPLLRVGSKPMIDVALNQIAEAGIPSAVVNLHYLGSQIRRHLAAQTAPRIAFSAEDPILDTGGGVAKALPLLNGSAFHTLNSDAIFVGPNPLRLLSAAWSADRYDALLLLVPFGNTHAYTRSGDFFLTQEGRVPVRRGSRPKAPLVYAGAQIVARRALSEAPEGPFSMNLIWDRLIAEQRLAAVTYPGEWVDVGTAEGLRAATNALAAAET